MTTDHGSPTGGDADALTGPPSTYVSLDQIVRELGTHRQTVRGWFASGALPGNRVGPGGQWMTTRAALNNFITGHKTPPSGTQSPAVTADRGPDGLGPLETK